MILSLKLLVFLICSHMVISQFADESVKEDSIYKPITIENPLIDALVNKFLTKVIEQEKFNSRNTLLSSNLAILTNEQEGGELTPEKLYKNFFNEKESFENITFSASRALRVGNLIIEESTLPAEELQVTLRSLKAPANLCTYPRIPPCSSNEVYRRIDGSCTNLNVPHWGKTNIPHKRFLPPRYEDGYDEVQRTGQTGDLLPNPRSVTLQLCSDNLQFDIARTTMTTAFGQFLDHDFALTALDDSISCICGDTSNPECINMPTPSEDSLNIVDQRCMTQTRSSPSFTNVNCGFSHREQMNTLTSPLDLSQVYGVNEAAAALLREFSGGLLKTVNKGINNRELLPQFGNREICIDETSERTCFLTGDNKRANINMLLASMQTLWVREHNRLARKLKELNPSWNDEKLYQETRRINIAQAQNIIYSEWLPIIVGWNAMAKYDLLSSGNGYYKGYNESVDVGVYNEVSTAAFRLHTLIRSTYSQIHPSHPPKTLSIRDITFRPVHAYEGSGVDGLLTGALFDNLGKYDSSITDGLHNRFLESLSNQTSIVKRFDLAAMNINRCRDHGCAPYIKYREWCGLGLAKTFSDLVEIDKKNQIILENLYKDVANIELFVGGISEASLPGSVVGPTFSCMIARQFRDFKRGDRFFFENEAPTNPYDFTLQQLNELHKVTMANILCDNVDGLTSIQPNAFLSSKVPGNGAIPCKQIPKLDLSIF